MIPRIISSRFASNRWQQGYVAGKLRTDPVYAAVLAAMKGRPGPLWDAGCGLGLLPFFLREHGWHGPVVGTDLDVKKVAQGNRVAQDHYADVELRVGSITEPPQDFRGDVALLDALHYVTAEEQQRVLEQIRGAVPPGGQCLIRFSARDRSWRYYATLLEEYWIRGIGWIRGGQLHFPSRAEVEGGFLADGWTTEIRPLWGRTPFNSYLLLARRPADVSSVRLRESAPL